MPSVTIAGNCGSLLLGGLVAFGLSGCVNMQYAMYWRMYPRDTWQMRCLVTSTWILDISHSVLAALSIWDSVIAPNGNLSADQLNKIPWSIAIAAELAVLMTFLTQSFFAYRIYILQKKWIVTVPVAILALGRLASASVSVSEMIRLGHYSLLLHTFPSWVITLGLSLSAFIDVLITVTLCHFFRQTRKARYSVATHRMLDTLTRWTLQNGLITCAGATASLICWKTMPYNLSFLGLHFVMGKLYANSLLASINARERIRKPHLYSSSGGSNQAVILPRDFGMNPPANPMTSSASSARMKGRHPIQVNVERSVVSMVDVHIDVPSDFNGASEQIYHLENSDQKGEVPV